MQCYLEIDYSKVVMYISALWLTVCVTVCVPESAIADRLCFRNVRGNLVSKSDIPAGTIRLFRRDLCPNGWRPVPETLFRSSPDIPVEPRPPNSVGYFSFSGSTGGEDIADSAYYGIGDSAPSAVSLFTKAVIAGTDCNKFKSSIRLSEPPGVGNSWHVLLIRQDAADFGSSLHGSPVICHLKDSEVECANTRDFPINSTDSLAIKFIGNNERPGMPAPSLATWSVRCIGN